MSVSGRAVGLGIVCLGLTVNEWTLEGLLVRDGSIESPVSRIIIASTQLLLLVIGSWIFVRIREFRMPGSREWLLLIASTGVALVVGVGGTEVVLRERGEYLPPESPMHPAESNLYEYDSTIGYKLHPRLKVIYRYPPESDEARLIVSNGDGFRSSRELGDGDGRLRVLVVGDSFVFGLGVGQEARVTERIEAMEPEWQVDNMGMTGWGVDLMIRALERYGKKAAPDIVVLAVYTDDFRRLLPYYAGVGFAYPKFELDGDRLISTPYPSPHGWERFRIVQAIYQWKWSHDRNRYGLNRALLERYLEVAEMVGFEPTVAFFPGRSDTEEDKERRGFLETWTSAHAVAYRDLTDAIQRAGVETVYISENFHWNSAGHEVAARELRLLIQTAISSRHEMIESRQRR